ncbi:MAG: hypothetical protein WCO84_03980 [bacterium]
MYYLFIGKDTQKSRTKMGETISAFYSKNPNSNVFRVSSDDFNESAFLEYIGGQSLFSNKFLISADGIFKNEEAKKFILKNIKEIVSSHNVFVFLEESLKKDELTPMKENAEKVFDFELSLDKEGKKSDFNPFAVSDAFGEKDKKKIWVVYQKALREGMASEEVFWKFTWQVKNLLLAKIAEKKGDASIEGLKISPFVIKKAKNYTKKFTEIELLNFYSQLISLYHDARRGVMDFDTATEAFILNLR